MKEYLWEYVGIRVAPRQTARPFILSQIELLTVEMESMT